MDSQNCKFFIYDNLGQKLLREESSEEALTAFVNYAKDFKIFTAALNFQSPLFLEDCWDDDPIGSAGLQAILVQNKLSVEQKRQLSDLFKPFDGIIYPEDVMALLSRNDIERMKAKISSDPKFAGELKKRKEKLGNMRYRHDEPFEITWMYYTQELYYWAKANGFDSFKYQSKHEEPHDNGFYVSFDLSQIKIIEERLFDTDAFLRLVGPVFRKQLFAVHGNGEGFAIGQDIFLRLGELELFWPQAMLNGFVRNNKKVVVMTSWNLAFKIL